MQKWEYLSIEHPDQIQLDELGFNGWEMCGVLPMDGYTNGYCYFKRPLEDRPEDSIMKE